MNTEHRLSPSPKLLQVQKLLADYNIGFRWEAGNGFAHLRLPNGTDILFHAQNVGAIGIDYMGNKFNLQDTPGILAVEVKEAVNG